MTNTYIEPKLALNTFNCPRCNAISHQNWYAMSKVDLHNLWDQDQHPSISGYKGVVNEIRISFCDNCSEYSLWVKEKLIYPLSSFAPLPTDDMPEDVKIDFLEAGKIINESPRGAGALLRLSLQKLMVDLGESGKNINSDIGNLVKNGLPIEMQQACDSVRVIGNEAVHPGELDLKDDHETVIALFELLNLIVDIMIKRPKKIAGLYQKLPKSKREGIKNRDIK